MADSPQIAAAAFFAQLLGVTPTTVYETNSIIMAGWERLFLANWQVSSAGVVSFDTLTLTDGQLSFPATQNASTDVNTLDDYEEGTWTPGLSFGGSATGVTYSQQNGAYIKIGKQVIASGRVILTSNGSGSGGALLTGLPFTSGSESGNESVGPAVITAGGTATGGVMAVRCVVNSTTAAVVIAGTDNAVQATEANLGDTTDFSFSLSYRAAS